MTRIFLDYDQKALDDAYDQSVYAPNREQILARFASTSEAVRRRITGALKEPFPDIAANVAITASIGAIVSDAGHRGAVTAEELIEQADAAMYADKGSTRVRPDPDRL